MGNPLVSIIVITYNSAKFVLETLESARAQTYQNIELIISDDGSKDATVEICRDWLKENSDRFVHSQLITVEQNTGIPANCNRGVKAAGGEWIKLIAGDDILIENAVSTYIKFTTENNYKLITCDLKYFSGDKTLNNYGNKKAVDHFFSLKTNDERLLYYAKYSPFLNSPGYFYHCSVIKKVNGYDEDYRVLEDNPFVYRVLQNEIKFCFLPQKLVLYRINIGSATGSGTMLNKDLEKCFKNYAVPVLSKNSHFTKFHILRQKLEFYIRNKGWGRTVPYRIYNKILTKLS